MLAEQNKFLIDEIARLILLQRDEDEKFRDAAILAITQGWAANGQIKIELKPEGPFGNSVGWICDFADALLAERNCRREQRQKGGA